MIMGISVLASVMGSGASSLMYFKSSISSFVTTVNPFWLSFSFSSVRTELLIAASSTLLAAKASLISAPAISFCRSSSLRIALICSSVSSGTWMLGTFADASTSMVTFFVRINLHTIGSLQPSTVRMISYTPAWSGCTLLTSHVAAALPVVPSA